MPSNMSRSDAGSVPTGLRFKSLKREIRKNYPKDEAEVLIKRLEQNKKQVIKWSAGQAYR